jgi:CHAT domain-containing protein
MWLRASWKILIVAVFIGAQTLTDKSGQDARFFARQADQKALNAGQLSEALKLYRKARHISQASSDLALQYRLLNNIGACQLALFRFQDAEQTLLEVRGIAKRSHDDALLGGADSNLAGVYAQMNNLAAAEVYARESVEIHSRTGKLEHRARALLTLAEILSRPKLTREGEDLFRDGIASATRSLDLASASAGWLHYGRVLMDGGRLQEAGRAFGNSYDLFRAARKSGKERSALTGEDAILWSLSRFQLSQRDFPQALESINSAIRISKENGGRAPVWRLYQTRAEAELGSARPAAALQDARTALASARKLRANIVPDNDNRIGIEGVLDATYSVLIEAGNRVYLETGDEELVRETFATAEENRAESLEAMLPATSDWRDHLATPEYRYKLSQLLAAQRVLLRTDSEPVRKRVARLETELAQMEGAAGAKVRPESGTVLSRAIRNLPPDAALLSFRLGDRVSWLWTVDHGKLNLYRLPAKDVLLEKIRVFETAIRDNDAETVATAGHRLYVDLFGSPYRSFQQSSQWYLSLDESLHAVAFPALVVEVTHRGPVYLTERKALETLPGAQLFEAPERESFANSRFVLAGDGIYNRADPRYSKPALVRPASWGMARLPGSGAEVQFAATLWRNTSLLTGTRMTKERLLKEIDTDPDVIHIASHVIERQDRWHTGILALGLDPAGEPDLLTSREIELHPVHARLVVMTGCSSGSSDALPASGLMGLTRAWLAAGAGEVLATRWPTMDESGNGLIGSFYVHLLASGDGNVPKALKLARRDMIAGGGWRAEPRYWSSFFLIGVR